LIGGALELGEEIGRGAMGHVFRARHVRLDRMVAVKFLSSELAADPDMKRRIEREARALALLSHPNIVQVFDSGEDEGQSYLVMELVEGRPLSSCIPLPPDQAVAMALQVCDALAYAHEKGVIHRDIKPENILVEANGHVKVTDFGIARLQAPGNTDWKLTGTGMTSGTPPYLAPEALQGAPPDPRLDVYALGVVLYQTVMGRLPIGSFEPLPGALDRVVRKALAPNPAQRTPSANALRHELSALHLTPDDELPGDERFWMYGAAMLSTAAAATAIWASMTSLTPRVVREGELDALTNVITEQLPDGRWISRARFETGPALGSVAAVALAFAALGLLRRHWREAHLDHPQPMRPLIESRRLMWVGLACVATYVARRWLEATGFGRISLYAPLVGGILELAALFYLFLGMLQAWRTARPLSREPVLFGGLALALAPPTIEFATFLVRWKP
jgi:serine/threonine-protein kinase